MKAEDVSGQGEHEFKSKFVHSMSYSISCQPFLSLSLNRVFPFVYIFVLLVLRLKSDNVWSFNALSVPFMPSFHYIPHSFILAFIVHVYIFCLLLLLPRYDNDTPRSAWGLG